MFPFFKKSRKSKDRSNSLCSSLGFYPLCGSVGEDVAHPSFSSLAGVCILLGEKLGRWMYVGPGRRRELPKCSSLFEGQSGGYEVLALEGCWTQIGTDSGTGNRFSVYYGLLTFSGPVCPRTTPGSGYSHNEVGGSVSTRLGGWVCSRIPGHKYIQKGAGILKAEIREQLIELMSKHI